ncbi:uncharacterized protein CFAP92 isoform X2 [Monodelphis domestica]|uniref:uncharacterized protein CFAP92 isoform X2 n=1 Tax=Monodelphis domestica TaxID=13616 RepID=UPI0024E21BE2|nr:uncharacterized protein CFAP92 isoform X2 [Monodelphis domestica]
MSGNPWEWDYEGKQVESPIMEQFSTVTLYQFEDYMPQEEAVEVKRSEHSVENNIKPYLVHSEYENDIPQIVPCTFTICLALPAVTGIKGKISHDKFKRIRPDLLSKMRRFYHIEYQLLPDDREPKQVDVVLFSTVIAKVFMESGIKSVSPWNENEKLWLSWKETHKISITKELLKKLNHHRITFDIWDAKEKMCKKARFSKVKSFSRQEDVHGIDEVKQMVLQQKDMTQERMPKPSVIKTKTGVVIVERHKSPSFADSERGSIVKIDPELDRIFKGDDFPLHLNSSRASGIPERTDESKSTIKQMNISSSTVLDSVKLQRKDARRSPKKKKKKYKVSDEDSELPPIGNQSIFFMQLNLMPLLAGEKTVLSHAKETNSKILDCYLNLTVDVPLMTDEQKQDLNPLIIKIKAVTSLPIGPVSPQEIQKSCFPVYCKYKFYNTPVHQTQGRLYGSHVYFEDVNVILIGSLNPRNLREYLEGPPMEVEIHDRDKKEDTYLVLPALFGEDSADANMNQSINVASMAQDIIDALDPSNKKDPYGIAKVSFKDLLFGQKLLDLFVPIQGFKSDSTSKKKDSKGEKRISGSYRPMEKAFSSLMPMGNYFESSTLLKLRIEIHVPLTVELSQHEIASDRFGRAIYIFDALKTKFFGSLLKTIAEINAKALDLDMYPLQDIQEVLSAFKVKVKVQANLDQDVITGFHLFDGKIHLFILEGLAAYGLRQLWEKYQNQISGSEDGNFKVLYNSELTFHERLYANLDSILYHIHLCKPLSSIVKQSMLFVRGWVPQPSLQALLKLHTICHSKKLRDVIERDLFPSAEMLKYMSQEFGIPVRRSLLTSSPLKTVPSALLRMEKSERNIPDFGTMLQEHDERYTQWKKEMERKRAAANCFIRKNIAGASLTKRTSELPEVKTIRCFPPDGKSVYNYSMQTLNSGEQAKQKLIAQMDKEKGKIFTYSKDYLSVLPECLPLKLSKSKSKLWLTPEGFHIPGYQTSFESNRHPKMPDENRVEDLKETWQENTLFTNILKPVLDRGRLSWDMRHVDFDIYTKPPSTLHLPLPPEHCTLKGKTKTEKRSQPLNN